MEYLDTFDIDGNFLGVQTREFCHSENPGCFHKAVWIWIKQPNGNILVQKRALTKKKAPGKYDMPVAGHVDAGETCLATCVRETKEELGIDTIESDFTFIKQFINHEGWEFGEVYLLEKDFKLEDIILQKEEVEKVEYLTYEEFVKLLYSDKFANHNKEYKDFVADLLK